MQNINLNIGGLIGALGCGGIAAVIVFTTMDAQTRTGPKLIIVAVIAGAFAGNFLWGLVFKKSE